MVHYWWSCFQCCLRRRIYHVSLVHEDQYCVTRQNLLSNWDFIQIYNLLTIKPSRTSFARHLVYDYLISWASPELFRQVLGL